MSERYSEGPEGGGLLMFAVAMMALAGTWAVIEGIAAIADSRIYTDNAVFVFSDLKTWGWVLIVVAVVQLVTSAGVFLRWSGVRWVGVAIAGVNSIAQLIVLPAYPLWALCLFALDILVMYGLISYGGPRR